MGWKHRYCIRRRPAIFVRVKGGPAINGDIRGVVEANLANRRGISRYFVWDDHAPQVARIGAHKSREILREDLKEGDRSLCTV